MRQLLPGDRTYIDWNFNVDWMRRAPDDPTRIVFGGLTGGRNQDLRQMAERLHARLLRIFPELTASASTTCGPANAAEPLTSIRTSAAMRASTTPCGYCFAGVPMGTLFGQKLARRILGGKGGDSAFDPPPPVRSTAEIRGSCLTHFVG